VPLESRNHILIESEPAWQEFSEVSREFLNDRADVLPRVRAPAAPKPPVDRFGECSGPDGARIAFASMGEGFPLVKAPNWMTHLDLDRSSPVYGHWLREGAKSNRVIRSDMRGFGKSELEPDRFD